MDFNPNNQVRNYIQAVDTLWQFFLSLTFNFMFHLMINWDILIPICIPENFEIYCWTFLYRYQKCYPGIFSYWCIMVCCISYLWQKFLIRFATGDFPATLSSCYNLIRPRGWRIIRTLDPVSVSGACVSREREGGVSLWPALPDSWLSGSRD
jgi:hypothetical protein